MSEDGNNESRGSQPWSRDSTPEPTQDISGRNIHPAKLSAMLKATFGEGMYEIHVCRD